MRILICITTFSVLFSCKQKAAENSKSVHIEPQEELTFEEQETDQVSITQKPSLERWFEPTELDTLLQFENSYSITLKTTDSIKMSEYFMEKEVLDSLNRIHGNSHDHALDVENHLLKTFGEYVRRDSLGLHLKMKDESWKLVSLKPDTHEADNTFEHYFTEFGFYSIRTQWGEGNGYKLINDQNGHTTDLFGRPYFSKNGKFIISISADIEAGYNRNGFQLFHNTDGELQKIGDYEPRAWGPYSAKWKDSSTIILKNETIEFKDGEMNYLDFYSELKIYNKS